MGALVLQSFVTKIQHSTQSQIFRLFVVSAIQFGNDREYTNRITKHKTISIHRSQCIQYSCMCIRLSMFRNVCIIFRFCQNFERFLYESVMFRIRTKKNTMYVCICFGYTYWWCDGRPNENTWNYKIDDEEEDERVERKKQKTITENGCFLWDTRKQGRKDSSKRNHAIPIQ